MNITNYPFYQAFNHLNDFFGVTLNEEDFETIALNGWRHIGNRQTKRYRYINDTIDNRLPLPCNVHIIESVNADYEDFQKTDNVRRDNYSRLTVESYIEGRSSASNTDYHRGKLLDYHQEGAELVFDKNHKNVSVHYRGIIADDEGLPFLNSKEVEAIATYCAYSTFYKKGLQTKDQQTLALAKDLKASWERACLQARTPERMTQNEMDEILDISTRWDKKRFGVSYKPIIR